MADAGDPRTPLSLNQLRDVIEQALANPQTGPTLYDSSGAPILNSPLSTLYHGSEWFPPGDPLRVVAPAGTPPRQFQFPVLVNRFVVPRATEQVGFPELRALSRRATLVRLAIETCKDTEERFGWSVQPKQNLPRGKRAKENDSRITELEDFFSRPDRRRTFKRWMRSLSEDLLGIDAPTVRVHRTRGVNGMQKEPYALECIDGATIKPLLDATGRAPLAGPAYEQVVYGVKSGEFSANDLLYMPRNPTSDKIYGYSPTEQCMMVAAGVASRELRQLLYNVEGNVPDVFIRMPKEYTPDQIERAQIWFDQHKGDPQHRTGIMVVPESGIQEMRENPGKTEQDEWWARTVCWAFSLSPLIFLKQGLNRATGTVMQDSALDEGLIPRQMFWSEFLERLIEMAWGWTDLTIAWDATRDPDPAAQAKYETAYVAAGVKTRNEVRELLGLEAIDGGDIATVTVGTQLVALTDLAAGKYTPLSPEEEAAQKAEAAKASLAALKAGQNGSGAAPETANGGSPAVPPKEAKPAPEAKVVAETPQKALGKAVRTIETVPKSKRRFWQAERAPVPPRARPSDDSRGAS